MVAYFFISYITYKLIDIKINKILLNKDIDSFK